MITAATCQRLKLPFHSSGRLSVPGGTAEKLITDYPVRVFIGNTICRVKFIVDPTNRHTLIGQDLIRIMGGPQAKWPYEFAHVPGYFEKEAPPDADAPPAPSAVPAATAVSRHHEEIAAWAMAELEKNNAQIAPNERCTHQAAMVYVIHKPGTKPSFRPQYPYAEKFVPFVDATIAQWLLEGKIVPLVNFPPLYCMPLLPLVKSVDAHGNILSIRLTVDARGINIGLEFTPFPLPDMRELLRKLTGTLFTELDLQSFFTQMPVHPDSQHKLVIHHRGRYYQWTVAPFGLASLPAQAQLLMNAVLKFCMHTVAYIDNVTTGSDDSAAAHIAALKPVFDAFLQWRLRLTIPKAKIAQLRLAALGYQREGNTVSLANDKKEVVRQWPTPENKESLARFLGFTCFLRDHIFDYASKTRVLEAVKNASRFAWTDEAQQCFSKLKEEIYHNALVLKVFDESKPTFIITDASTVGLAGILYQPEPADAEMPTPNNLVYLCSRAARGAEQAYPAYKAELNAGRYAMSKFKQYLYGRHFTWLTDHRSLTFMTEAAELNRTLLNWREEFANFSFDVRHVEGAHNIMADALSRCYPDRFREGVATRALQPAPPESDEERHQRLARCAHLWGHWGVRSTLERLRRQGHEWSNMETSVRVAIDNCNACRQWSLGLPRSSPITSPMAEQPWSHISFDPVEMPASNGLRTLVVIVDQFSGYVLLRAAPDKSARSLAQILWQVIADFGPPRRIHSDGEATNVAGVLAALRSMHGVEHETITPYNPQQNGKAEAAVKSTLTLVHKLLTDSGSPWHSVLGSVQLMMNTKTRSLTRIDPFRLMFGRAALEFDMSVELSPDLPARDDPVEDYQKWLSAQFAQISELWPGRLEHVRDEQGKASQYFSERHRTAKVPLPLDAWVMCKNTTRASKQEPPFEGPFKIVAYDERAKAYTVIDAADEKSKRQVPMAHIKPIIHYRHGQTSEPTYHVEEILDHRVVGGKDEFLIKWYGYPISESTWTKRADMHGHRAILDFFRTLKPTTLTTKSLETDCLEETQGTEITTQMASTFSSRSQIHNSLQFFLSSRRGGVLWRPPLCYIMSLSLCPTMLYSALVDAPLEFVTIALLNGFPDLFFLSNRQLSFHSFRSLCARPVLTQVTFISCFYFPFSLLSFTLCSPRAHTDCVTLSIDIHRVQ
jgi:transposase InsO family protein